jgi:hypothetical protein
MIVTPANNSTARIPEMKIIQNPRDHFRLGGGKSHLNQGNHGNSLPGIGGLSSSGDL